jgi:hypothetical protein
MIIQEQLSNGVLNLLPAKRKTHYELIILDRVCIYLASKLSLKTQPQNSASKLSLKTQPQNSATVKYFNGKRLSSHAIIFGIIFGVIMDVLFYMGYLSN